MKTILYYVSGHGFGHAVRAAQVIDSLSGDYGHKVVARTKAPAWLFPSSDAVVIEREEVDSGPAQVDSITTDIVGTYERFADLASSIDNLVERELKVVDRIEPKVIVTDIAPLGVAVATKRGIPVVVVANFLWDWILEGYVKSEPRFSDIASWLKELYAQADVILKTPLSGGFEGYENVVDIPLIAKSSSKPKDTARKELSLPMDKALALVSFGGSGLESFYEKLSERCTLCDLIALGDGNSVSGGIRFFDRQTTVHGDLLSAADIVIGKLGYGLCSELIATRRPILYTGRKDFAEYNILDREIRKYINVEEISREAFFGSNLDGFLTGLLNSSHPLNFARTDGAQVAAKRIAGFL